MVEPNTLLIIKLGTRLAAMAQIEEFHQFVHRHQFLVVTRIPAQQSQEVDNRFGQIAGFAIT